MSSHRALTINLLKGESVDDDPEVVEEGERDYHGPVVAEAARWVEYEGPVLGGTDGGGATVTAARGARRAGHVARGAPAARTQYFQQCCVSV